MALMGKRILLIGLSYTCYIDFVSQQRDELLASGALVEWDKVSTVKPQFVNGLGVPRITRASSLSQVDFGLCQIRLRLPCNARGRWRP